jgi:hypothetical protein
MSAATDPAIYINTAVATGNITDNENGASAINATLTSSKVGTEAGPTNLVYTISIPTNNYSVNGDLIFDN